MINPIWPNFNYLQTLRLLARVGDEISINILGIFPGSVNGAAATRRVPRRAS